MISHCVLTLDRSYRSEEAAPGNAPLRQCIVNPSHRAGSREGQGISRLPCEASSLAATSHRVRLQTGRAGARKRTQLQGKVLPPYTRTSDRGPAYKSSRVIHQPGTIFRHQPQHRHICFTALYLPFPCADQAKRCEVSHNPGVISSDRTLPWWAVSVFAIAQPLTSSAPPLVPQLAVQADSETASSASVLFLKTETSSSKLSTLTSHILPT